MFLGYGCVASAGRDLDLPWHGTLARACLNDMEQSLLPRINGRIRRLIGAALRCASSRDNIGAARHNRVCNFSVAARRGGQPIAPLMDASPPIACNHVTAGGQANTVVLFALGLTAREQKRENCC